LFLVGTWRGTGTVLPRGVAYAETSTFAILKRTPQATVVAYEQRTRHAATGAPMHAENGFLKILAGDSPQRAELALSHPFSVNEMYARATLDSAAKVFEAEATEADGSFQRGPTARGAKATTVRRKYALAADGATLIYDLYLGVDGAAPKHHLHCEMTRVEAPPTGGSSGVS